MKKKSLQADQLNAKLMVFSDPSNIIVPPTGWINAIRTTLGISLEQLGKKLMITKQSMMEIEQREKDGSLTINRLKEVAEALDMKFVYGFVPQDGSIEALIERKSIAAATEIVLRTSQTMKLEDQENSKERIDKAIRELADQLKTDLSKIIWD